MADNRSRTNSRQNSARRSAGGAQSMNSGKSSNLNRSGSRDLLSREAEYKRLNEELEAKTANLVKEAEQVMRDQDDILNKRSLLDNINSDDFLNEYQNDDDDSGGASDIDIDAELYGDVYGSASGLDSKREPRDSWINSQPNSSRAGSAKASARPPSKNTNKTKPINSARKNLKPRPGSGTRSKSRSAHEDVAVFDDDAFMTGLKNFSIQDTISNIEHDIDDGKLPQDDQDDIMPSAAAEMGSEAQIRFLKAKLRVMQEELDRLSQECNKKEEISNTLTSKIKEADDERNRLQRTNVAQQTQIDKYKRLADDAKGKAESLETQSSSVKKELEALKRAQKQQTSSQSVTEVRLNRALEDVEKYKTQLQKAKASSKDSSESEKRRIEQLMAENKRLEKQKSELITGFKKQMKLIDILKRQKIHIEAAKMLAFTEEEFVKALEWGN